MREGAIALSLSRAAVGAFLMVLLIAVVTPLKIRRGKDVVVDGRAQGGKKRRGGRGEEKKEEKRVRADRKLMMSREKEEKERRRRRERVGK